MLCKEQQKIVSHFKSALASDTLRHAYIISASSGMGKKRAADELQLLFACNKGVGCGVCEGCNSAKLGAHTDIIRLSLGDKKVYEIGRIRELIKKVYQKPTLAHKLIIIEDAHCLGAICQNALLKVIEEPPPYAVFVLLCDNLSAILPTVLSRVMTITMQPWKRSELEEICPLDSSKRYLYDLAEGNPALLLSMANDGEFSKIRDTAINSFVGLFASSAYGVYDAVDAWLERKESVKDMLNVLALFLSDVLLVSLDCNDHVRCADKLKECRTVAAHLSPKAALEITQLVLSCSQRMARNENLSMALFDMFMKIKEIIT
ncbi:MAG: hypothetical protein IKA95_05280 [Clostridia bacterium]|nr:hypothetical protein [Clostridia bacterium]